MSYTLKRRSKIKLDEYNKILAGVNEIETALELSTLLGLDKSIAILTEEKKIVEEEFSTLFRVLAPNEQNDLEYAAEIKLLQGKNIANKLLERDDIIPSTEHIDAIIWSNTSDKFLHATGEEPHDNPSDFVIIYKKVMGKYPVIFGLERRWFGVSLKASFGKNEIGQYNSSSCKFAAGVLSGEDNKSLTKLCTKKSTSEYNRIQEAVNGVYYNFLSTWCVTNIQNWDMTKNAKHNKAAWQHEIESNGGKKGDFAKTASAARVLMYSQGIDIFMEYLASKDNAEAGLNSNQVILTVNAHEAATMVACYLRMNKVLALDGQPPNYIKASALKDNVILELPGIYNYLPKGFNVDSGEPFYMVFTKLANDTLNLSCSGTKSIDFRLKLASVPPSAIKINGQNNFYVVDGQDITEDMEVEGKAGRTSIASGSHDNILAEYTAFVKEAIDLYIDTENDGEYVDGERENDYEINNKMYLDKYKNLTLDDINQAILEYKEVLIALDSIKARDMRHVFRSGGYYSGLGEAIGNIIANIEYQQNQLQYLHDDAKGEGRRHKRTTRRGKKKKKKRRATKRKRRGTKRTR
jgi:hypothetical protein